MRKLLLALLAIGALSTSAQAQNKQCPDRRIGDSTNACANTRFVQQNIVPSNVAVFRPETHGAVCDNTTDSTAAFGLMATAVNAAGGGIINLSAVPTNCVYKVFPAPSVGNNNLAVFSGVTHLVINCNGATIATAYSFAAAAFLNIWAFTDASNVTINDCKYSQTTHAARDVDRGTRAIYSQGPVFNLTVNNMKMTGGNSAYQCSRAANATRSSGVLFNNVETYEVYYGIAADYCPDNLTASNFRTSHAARSYISTNINTHQVQISSDSSDGGQDILVAGKYNAAETGPMGNVTANISIDYTNKAGLATGTGVDSFFGIVFQTEIASAEGASLIDNIRFNGTIVRGDARPGVFAKILNQTSTSKNRILSNVALSGTWIVQAHPGDVMQLMSDVDWTGLASVINLSVSNFYCSSAGTSPVVRVDGRAIIGPFTIEKVWGSGAGGCGFTPTNMPISGVLYYNQAWLPTQITP